MNFASDGHLIKAFMETIQSWQLSDEAAGGLVGVPAQTVHGWRSGEPVHANEELEHAVHRAQQGGFPRAAAAQDDGDGSFFERERNFVQQQAALRRLDGYVSELNSRAHAPRILCSVSVSGESAMPKRDR